MPQAEQRGIRVLLIEDNPADARLVREALKGLGRPPFVIVVADRLAAGLTALENGGFDVALVDLSLPDSRGLQTFLDVRERARSIPVLVLSGLEDSEVAARAVREGAQDYVYKSQLMGEQLARSILYALSRQQLLQQLEESVSELRASEERYKVVTEAAQDAIITVDEADRIVFANSAAERLFGRSKDQMLDLPATELLPQDSRASFDAALAAASRTPSKDGPAEPIALAGRHKDGTRVPLELTVGVTSVGGQRRFTGVLRDVSRRRAAEEALRSSEQRLALIYGSVLDPIFMLAVESGTRYRFVSVNEAFLRATGLRPEQVVGKTIEEVLPPDSQALVVPKYREAMETRGVVQWEEVAAYPAGKRVGEVSVAPVLDAEGRCTHIIGAVHDVTATRAAEQMSRESEERYRRIVETAQEGIWVIDSASRTTFVNHAMAQMLGEPREALIGRDPLDFMTTEGRPQAREEIQNLADTGTAPRGHIEREVVRRDGSSIWVSTASSPLYDEHGDYLGALAMVTDVTGHRKAEQALEEARQFREALIDVVSHEFRTPVTVIQGYAELMGTGALKPDSPAWHDARARIARSSKHLGFLLTSILELSRLREGGRAADPKALKTIDLFTEAATTMDARRPAPSRPVTIEVAPGAEEVRGDFRMLLIALVELLDNAAKFSPSDMPIVLRASALDGEVLLEVEDHGHGIPENVRKDIFKPFVQADISSVRKTGGVGLGLAVAHGLVKAQGGRLEMDSKLGKGSTARIVLPRAQPA